MRSSVLGKAGNGASLNAGRLENPFGAGDRAAIPPLRARCRATAFERSENTPTISATRVPSAIASISACRLLPRPEARTAMRYGRDWGLGVGDWGERSADSDTIATVGLDHCADPAVRQGEPVEVGFDRRRGRGGDDQHEAEAARSEEHTTELQSLMRISTAG